MRVLKHGLTAVVGAASVAILSLALFLCNAWLLSGALPLQLLALTAMSISGSSVIALMEFRLSSTVRCCAQRKALKSDCSVSTRQDLRLDARSVDS